MLLVGAAATFALVTRAPPPPDDDALSASAMAALAAAGTAAERHRGVHGAWPRTLDDLVPSQLSAVPPDPFADGRPLSLGPDPVRGDGLVIYSIGPDRTDHRGLPRDPVTGRGDLLYPLD